jgi:hypothetical protein
MRLRSETAGLRGGQSAAHRRDSLQQGVEVGMARDATAGARNEGVTATGALVNCRALACALWTTHETFDFIEAASARGES